MRTFFIIYIFLISIFVEANAAVPLIMEADIVGNNLNFWWKKGEFIAGEKDSDKFITMTEKMSPTPVDISDWKQLAMECSNKNSIQGKLGTHDVQLDAVPVQNGLSIQLRMDKLIVAKNLIARPVQFCAMYLLEADKIPGPEIIVIWKLREEVNGVTIFRVPETVK